MKGTLSLANDVLIDSAYAAFVVGRSKIHGEVVDNAQLIIDGAEELGFNIIGRFDRNMNSNRKSFNLSHANIKKKRLLWFRKMKIRLNHVNYKLLGYEIELLEREVQRLVTKCDGHVLESSEGAFIN